MNNQPWIVLGLLALAACGPAEWMVDDDDTTEPAVDDDDATEPPVDDDDVLDDDDVADDDDSAAPDPGCAADEVPVGYLCLPAELSEWNLQVDPADLAMIKDDQWEDIFIPCTLSADGVDYGACQVRLRGGSSRDWPKRSFRVEFIEDADHPGYQRKINLRAEYNDRTYMRNFLAHKAFKKLTDLPVPRIRYLRLAINGDDYGLFTEVERIGGKFLERNARDREAAMYEGEGSEGTGALMPLPNEAAYRERYPKKTGDDADYSDLIGLIEDQLAADWADGGSARLEQAFHLDGYISYMATMLLLQNEDHVTNNFFLSFQNGAWETYPWDMDMSFGCQYDEAAHDSFCDDYEADGYWENGTIWPGDDLDDCWCNLPMHLVQQTPLLSAQFQQRACDLMTDPWWTIEGPALVDQLGSYLEPHVATDTHDAIDSLGDFADYRAEITQFFGQREAYLRSEMECF